MALKYIAVQNCTLSFVNPSHTGTINIISPPSTTVKVDNKGVYTSPLAISISNGSDGSITNATGTGTIIATATFVKVDNQFVIRVDDESLPITMTGTPPPPGTGPNTYITQVRITNANQTSTKAE